MDAKLKLNKNPRFQEDVSIHVFYGLLNVGITKQIKMTLVEKTDFQCQ